MMTQQEPMRLDLHSVHMGEVTNGTEYRQAMKSLADEVEAGIVRFLNPRASLDPKAGPLEAQKKALIRCALRVVWHTRPRTEL